MCAIVAALPSCHSGPSNAPNIILVVVDTLRADRVGVYGNPRGLTPFIDELATRGVVFKNTYAGSSWTVPSVASLFTSRFPSQHHVVTFDSKISDDEVTLAERLDGAGYDTGGFSANFRLVKELGYAQGFHTWGVYTGEAQGIKARGDRLRTETLRWLGSEAESAKPGPPRFLYLQYMEPHAPYDPPEPFRAQFERTAEGVDPAVANARMRTFNFKAFTPAEVDVLESLYDGEVASADAELRALFNELQARGLLNHAVVIVTADHGEEFKEHGHMAHGHALFNETIRVPLILMAPGIPGGQVIEDNVSLLDIAPTILDLIGQTPQSSFEGRSLMPLLRRPSLQRWLFASKEASPDVISELPKTGSRFDIRAHSQALVRGTDKLLIELSGQQKTETPALYDLRADPGETTPLHPDGTIQILETALQERTDALVKRASLTKEVGTVDEATKEKLRALGYHF